MLLVLCAAALVRNAHEREIAAGSASLAVDAAGAAAVSRLDPSHVPPYLHVQVHSATGPGVLQDYFECEKDGAGGCALEYNGAPVWHAMTQDEEAKLRIFRVKAGGWTMTTEPHWKEAGSGVVCSSSDATQQGQYPMSVWAWYPCMVRHDRVPGTDKLRKVVGPDTAQPLVQLSVHDVSHVVTADKFVQKGLEHPENEMA